MGAGIPRPPDHRRLAEAARRSRPRSSARAGCTWTIGTSATRAAPASRRRSSTPRCTWSTTTRPCARPGASLVLYLPKIQTAEEAALWNDILTALEAPPGPAGRHREGLRARGAGRGLLPADGDPRRARATHFVGFNTGRWDYINSVSDAMAWDPGFLNPNIDAITMTYGYMRHYEDRVRRAVNTPDRNGPVRLVAGRDGAQHPRGIRRGRRERHGARDGRGRTRAARGRQRQVGGPLEDGAHRPARVGEGGRRQPAGPAVSARSPTRRRTPTA